ncbi:hypothetical protein CEXT_544921 [Caerostris extrusa]|uniref:Uncharacterized protein n=1 Tax=Caerostris extrusa TaxID=172846 RepID=A0AAV4N1W6_CAEEX|nr:hypothetical protein CEXT_544921 [Caerostris extrusa]
MKLVEGASQDVLRNYKPYVRPIFDYGSELLIIVSNSVLSKIDFTQNWVFCLITGATTSTPIEPMKLQANIELLSDHRDKSAYFLRKS